MSASDDLTNALRPVIDMWLAGQVDLPLVQRWSKYDKPNDPHGGVRPQNTLQHSYSIVLLGTMVMHMMREANLDLDGELLLTALHLHDHSEGDLKRDTLYIDKTDEHDLREYEAFVKRFKDLPSAAFRPFEIAFLLQFAGKNPASFPEHARNIMGAMQGLWRNEILAFDFIERLDYVLYALEQFCDRGNARILVQVLRHQVPKLDALVAQIPTVRPILWTKPVRNAAVDFLAQHEGQWIEQPGER